MAVDPGRPPPRLVGRGLRMAVLEKVGGSRKSWPAASRSVYDAAGAIGGGDGVLLARRKRGSCRASLVEELVVLAAAAAVTVVVDDVEQRLRTSRCAMA